MKLSGKRRRPYGVRVTTGWDGGKQVRRYISYHTTKREAIEALAAYNKDPFVLTSKDMKFKDVWDHWFKAEYEEGSRASQSAWRAGYSHCEPIKGMSIGDIRYSHLTDIMKGKGPSTQSQIKGIVSKLFKYAIKHEWTDRNPAQYVGVKNKGETKKKAKVFSMEEIRDIWAKVDEYYIYELVLILLYTGLRITELLEIRQRNIHGDYMIGGKKSDAGIDRIIPLHRRIRPLIEKRMNGGEYLIQDEDGNPRDYHQVQRVFVKHFPGRRLHETRHTFTSRMHTAGVNEVTLKIIVGHAQNDITSKVYIHKHRDELLEAVHLLEE